jgi:KaiC/GvpD/RAD55 family RecA-like ATPase
MGKTIYIDLELEKRKIIKQMKDLEKDLAQSIKRTEKNAKIKVELDDKELKKSTRRVSTDLTNTIKKVSNKKARLILDS